MIYLARDSLLLFLATTASALRPLSLPYPEHDISRRLSGRSPGNPQENSPAFYPGLVPRQEAISFPVQQQNKSRFFRQQGQDVRDGLNGTLLVDYLGYWFVDIKVSNQFVHPIIDTGSADLWIMSPLLPPNTTAGLPLWDPNDSTTDVKLDNESFSIGYGEGGNGIAGPVYLDSVTIGPFSVPQMAIGSATYDQGFFPGEVGSGILGLAFQALDSVRPDKQKTFMEVLQDSLPEPIMTANFFLDGNGTFGFGTIDHDAYTGDLVKLAIDNITTYPGSWSVENVSYSANGKHLGTFDMVFDTGGPQTTADKETVYAYYDMVPGAVDILGDGKGWNVPCDAVMPDLKTNFPGSEASYVIPGSAFLQVDFGNGTCQSWFVVENSRVRGLSGNAFFMTHYVIYNQAEPSVSWARNKRS